MSNLNEDQFPQRLDPKEIGKVLKKAGHERGKETPSRIRGAPLIYPGFKVESEKEPIYRGGDPGAGIIGTRPSGRVIVRHLHTANNDDDVEHAKGRARSYAEALSEAGFDVEHNHTTIKVKGRRQP